ncbi:ESPR domain-containing protein, partial [Bacillus intestinalis]|nr:ESPR domain-containing protein [Bacillus spizizenii]
RTYRSIWNEALGAWVAASEHDSARGKPNKSAVTAAVLAAVAMLPSLAGANTFVPGTTNGSQFTVSSCTSSGGNGTVGRTTTGNTNAYPVDGSGTYSTGAGCNSSGNNNLAATAYGAFAQVTGTGGTATGFLSSAALWGTSAGLESTASGAGSTALG